MLDTPIKKTSVNEQLPTASYLLVFIAIFSTRKQSHVRFLSYIFNLG